MVFSWAQEALAVLSGGAVGFSLGLIGGGGSILAVPLLLYVVGVGDPHVAIGTSALSVAANAFANLFGHWRSGNVKWSCAVTFALAGVVGAALGSTLGKLVDGQQLLFLFALAMKWCFPCRQRDIRATRPPYPHGLFQQRNDDGLCDP